MLTIDLPDRTGKSYIKRNFRVKCGERELVSREIYLDDLSREAGRTFKREFTAARIDFKSCELTWNFSGEIYDSGLNEKLPLIMMQSTKYNDQVEGVGLHFQIGTHGMPEIQKKVYLRSRRLEAGG